MSLKIFSRAILIFIILFIATLVTIAQDSTSNKYPMVLIHQNDTVMAFTLPQANVIAQRNDSLKTYRNLYSNSQNMVDTLQGKIVVLNKITVNDSLQLQAKDGLITVGNKETRLAKDERDYYRKKYNQQRFITGATALVGITGWILYIFK